MSQILSLDYPALIRTLSGLGARKKVLFCTFLFGRFGTRNSLDFLVSRESPPSDFFAEPDAIRTLSGPYPDPALFVEKTSLKKLLKPMLFKTF